MKPHLTFAEPGPSAAHAGIGVADVSQDWLDIVPESPRAWRHTLILTGSLDGHSTAELQEEIECLYQEGVTSVVLDLRRLNSIDVVAVQAIASLGALYRRRGLAVAVVGGSTSGQLTPTNGHAAVVPMAEANGRIAARRFSPAADAPVAAWSTTMIKEL
jgi:ABC-type transporter Mla MlaB component